tara:strand:+ start:162 stop:455 length:294 start_codon:yes stop_codon:yes gene_type:complete
MKNIQLIRLTSGEEIIADVDLNGIDTDTIIMKDAIVLIPAGEGKIGFMPFMPYTKAKDGIEVDLKFVMFMVEPVKDLVEQHRAATSEIELPNSKIIS